MAVYVQPPLHIPKFQPDDWNWHERALCKEVDNDLFYYADEERGDTKNKRIHTAKSVCNKCTVKAECLAWAQRVPEAYGIWGGLTPEERKELRS